MLQRSPPEREHVLIEVIEVFLTSSGDVATPVAVGVRRNLGVCGDIGVMVTSVEVLVVCAVMAIDDVVVLAVMSVAVLHLCAGATAVELIRGICGVACREELRVLFMRDNCAASFPGTGTR